MPEQSSGLSQEEFSALLAEVERTIGDYRKTYPHKPAENSPIDTPHGYRDPASGKFTAAPQEGPAPQPQPPSPQQPQSPPMRGPVNPLMQAGEARPSPRMPMNPLAMR